MRFWFFVLLISTTFFSFAPAKPVSEGRCNPQAQAFYGYTFINPDIINKNAAYAPFFVRWDDYYKEFYFKKDQQKDGNIEEWVERFCGEPEPLDVEYVVYKASESELNALRREAEKKARDPRLPFSMDENTFAIMLAFNGCTDVVDYLLFAKRCEPHVVPFGDAWKPEDRNVSAMLTLIEEGLGRFKETQAPFLRLRYAYQIVRLAHYARMWDYTVEVYNYLITKIDRRKPSIIYYWTLGHLAGALRQQGKYPEAAYRYSIIFRECPSKRIQAFRSFLIRNDADWKAALRLCERDEEIATLYTMRAATSDEYSLSDLTEVYELYPQDKQLELMLTGAVQHFEKIFLRTRITDKKYGEAKGVVKREQAAHELIELQKFVAKAVEEGKVANPKIWQALDGYLHLLAGDRYAAEKAFVRTERLISEGTDYDQHIFKQLETWRLLLEILNLDVTSAYVDDAAMRIRSYSAFREHPHFEPFLQDWLAAAYVANANPGKALLVAYEPKALRYNPRLDVLEDLLRAAASERPRFLEEAMQIDTNPDQIRAQLLEIKAVRLLAGGQTEAALVALRSIAPAEQLRMKKFSPFKEVFDEKINRPVSDTLVLNRRQIVEKMIDYEFKAKAAEAVNDPAADWYYYLLGMAWYNMSYYGYAWEATDYYRSGYNWLRLGQGPVFPLPGSPDGNRENTDLTIPLAYFERVMERTRSSELAARAAFMAARCHQKQWMALPGTRYHYGTKLIPTLPAPYYTYYDRLIKKYSETDFFKERVKECKWLAAYAK
jgi:hypothetical protein